jgi:hypothetical protein
MEYFVTFTGDSLPEKINQEKAVALMNAINSKAKPEYIKIGERLVKTTTIRSIDPQKIEHNFDTKTQEYELDRQKTNAKHFQERTRRMALSLPERAREPEILKLAWWATTGLTTPPPDAALTEIFLASEYYLTEHPDSSFANPHCYKYVLDKFHAHAPANSIPFIKGAMSLIERVLLAD